MPRSKSNGRSANNKRKTRSNHEATLLFAEREIEKGRSEYKSHVNKIQASALVLADRIGLLREVETVLSYGDDDTKEENLAFLQTQREKLKALCHRNEMSMRNVDAFIGALSDVRTDLLQQQQLGEQKEMELQRKRQQRQQQQQNQEDENEDDTVTDDNVNDDENQEPEDYEEVLSTKMKEHSQSLHDTLTSQDVALEDSHMVRKCMDRLGEKPPKKKRTSRSGNDDDEEELEIMHQPRNDNEMEFKCPVTGQFFVNPVKNKNCGHYYEYEGIRHHLKNKKKCPVAGCVNSHVTLSQLEEDEEMKIKVRRFKVRSEKERQQRMSQDIDDSEFIVGRESM
mmetsp:Transcript_578/g.939  ORF Transcript_578/g.939 Transcript_578/m.939 type:complete len:339 (-) Transcript_578:57-1073(-)